MHDVKWRLSGLGHFIPGLLCLLLFCSCATAPPPSGHSPKPALPADTSFNKGAGRGNPLFLTLRLEGGEKLLFMVDTGCSRTILDKSLESKLGKRLSTAFIWYGYFGLSGAGWHGVYQAPALYLGATRLVTSDRICTDDLRTKSWLGRPIMGILGMDCLRHYCLQLDFEANTIHFFDPDELKTNGLGKSFPLALDTDEVTIHADFFGAKDVSVRLDTGDSTDGALRAGLFHREIKKQKPLLTNQWKSPGGTLSARFPETEFGGATYTNLRLHKCPLTMALADTRCYVGLQFLARHLVTLNFPKRMVYLQRRSVGPLPDGMAELKESFGYVSDQPPKDVEARFEAYAKQKPGGRLFLEAGAYSLNLKKQGQLPGWLKNDTGYGKIWLDPDLVSEWARMIKPDDFPVAQTLTVFKKGDTSIYNYTVVKPSPDAPWQLQRAWKAAPNGHILKDYPIH
jgi:hypothetical protein